MDEENNYQLVIDEKCPTCFRKNECWLLRDRHAGIELCLGPFKDQEDRIRKIREDNEQEKKRADLRKYVSEYVRDQYRANKDLFEHGAGRSKRNPDEDKE